MSLTLAALRELVGCGLDAVQILRIAEAQGEPRRAADAERQRRRRERQRDERSHVTSHVTEPGDQRVSPEPPSEIQPPSPPKGGSSPVAAALEAWNALAAEAGLPIAKALTRERRRRIGVRLGEAGPEGWAQALAAVRASPFCRGDNARGFRADLDFVCQPKSFQRLREGFYGPAEPAEPDGQATGAARTARWGTDEWTTAVGRWRDTGRWPEAWGPPPGQAGCRAPPEALAERQPSLLSSSEAPR
jgi:hypothetical protein